MNKKTSQKIIDYLEQKKQSTAHELADALNISPRAVFKQLKNLTRANRIDKTGRPPKVFYFLAEAKKAEEKIILDPKLKKILEERFLLITPLGEMQSGAAGFQEWCVQRNLPVAKTANEYVTALKKYDAFPKGGLIDGIKKIKNTFEKVALDHLYYLDFYTIERFGKTKLGQMLLYGKQSQNKEFIKKIIAEIKPQVEKLIKSRQIDAVGFIPPTLKRETQFMKELEKHLSLPLPVIRITKIKTPIIVPQKTLSKLEDRVTNARRTIVVEENRSYKKVLLIDDAVGSGASMNETAAQLKDKKVAAQVIGLAVTGSFKGFDVISEV